MSENFKRVVEDFDCENCGAHVIGNGFTNHCPHCLFSQHVDKSPGDRANTCGGLMEPIDIATASSGYVLTHRCKRCGHQSSCKTAEDDDVTGFIEYLSESSALNKRLDSK